MHAGIVKINVIDSDIISVVQVGNMALIELGDDYHE